MSTLGGSRGERHAKPKFSALDINSLYRTSRGESLEPSTQKNTVQRKHGMQSLGKVPSARRPPANLPSLKAETSSPQVNDQTSSNTTNSTVSITATATGGQETRGNNNLSTQNSATGPGSQISITTSSNSISSTLLASSNQLSTTSTSSATWSSVTTGNQIETGQQPIFQSPLFQHEFPSLDGSVQPVTAKSSRGSDVNAQQQQQINSADMRLQIDGNGGINQQQIQNSSGGNRGNGGENGHANQANPIVPPQLRALMPSFMYRGGSGAGGMNTGSGGNIAMPPSYGQNNQQSLSIPARPKSQPGAHSQPQIEQPHYHRNNYNDDHRERDGYYNRDTRDTRDSRDSRDNRSQVQRRGPPPRHQNRSEPLPYEPEIALLQRPIIKEEELKRMDSIAKDEGWAADDEIDYNKKLVFSDDESIDSPTAEGPMSMHHHSKEQNDIREHRKSITPQRNDDDNRSMWNRERDKERERNERNEREHHRDENQRSARQNGHRPNVDRLDPEVFERVKMRKEEEEKRVLERKQAANKKLQELEQKINKKKEMDEMIDQGHKPDNEYRGNNQRGYDKYERDINSRERDPNMKDSGYANRDGSRDGVGRERVSGGGGSTLAGERDRDGNGLIFSKQFQSNLPPRFLKQQQERHSQPPTTGATRNTANNYQIHAASGDQKSVPFAQQYDPRYIHSQNYKQQSHHIGIKRNSSDEMMTNQPRPRKRIDSEDEDRFSSGRESISRNSIGDRPPQLARSVSDSSQRKTSVSSEDRPERCDRSESRELGVVSWLDEPESESKRLDSIKSDTTLSGDDQPKQILQRNHKISTSSSSNIPVIQEKEPAELEQIKTQLTEKKIESPKPWSSYINEPSSESEIDPLKEIEKSGENAEKSAMMGDNKEDDSKGGKDDDKNIKRQSPRIMRHGDMHSGSHRTMGGNAGYGGQMYRGGNNWNRRGGGGGRRYNDYYNESEGTDDGVDYEYSGRRSPKISRKDGTTKIDTVRQSGGGIGAGHHKEGFTPRGEPSRRGRGGGTVGMTGNSFRRSATAPTGAPKRIDNYGPPSSKSPFGANEEKVGDGKKDIKDKKPSPPPQSGNANQRNNQNMKSTIEEGFDEAGEQSDGQDKNKIRNGSKGTGLIKPGMGRIDDRKTKITPNTNFGGPQRKDSVSSSGSKSADKPSSSIDKDLNKTGEKSKMIPINKPKDDTRSSSNLNAISKTISKPQSASGQKLSTSPSNTMTQQQQQQQQKQMSGNTLNQTQQQQQQQQQQQLSRDRQMHNKLPPRLAAKRDPRPINRNDGLQGPMMTWEKPLTPTQQDNASMSGSIPVSMDSNNQQMGSGDLISGSSDLPPNGNNLKTDKQLLDGTTPLKSMLFENTNYKQIPGPIKRQSSPHQQNDKKQDDMYKASNQQQAVGQTISELMDSANNQQQQQQQYRASAVGSQENAISSALQNMSFGTKTDAEYEKDFFGFDADISQLTDDNKAPVTSSGSKNSGNSGGLYPARASMHSVTSSGQNTISPSTADLNMKIASVKKVWETAPPMPTVLEHSGTGGGNDDSHMSGNYSSGGGQHQHSSHLQYPHVQHVPHALSPAGSYSTSFSDANSLEHFVKTSASDSVVSDNDSGYNPNGPHGGQSHQHPSNLGLKHSNDSLGSGPNNGSNMKMKSVQQPPQQQMHQSGLGMSPPPMQQGALQAAPQPYYPPSQYGNISAIPSPPAMIYNSSAAMSNQGGLFGHFQLENRTQYSQYPGPYGTAANAPFNAYMQTPNIQGPPAPAEMYQSLTSQYRQPPYNQTQPINNQSTVLISSTSNSLMSASVKPSTQQIGAIGSKSGAIGQYNQQFMGMFAQQGPPIQNNSYYSNSASGQGAFFGGPTGGANQNYGLQAANMFGGHGAPAPSNPPPQQQVPNFGMQYNNSPIMPGASPAAMNQQYRGGPQNQQNNYMKSNQQQSHGQDSYENMYHP